MNAMTRTMDVRTRRAVRNAFTGWAQLIARAQIVHARLTAGMPPEYRLSDLVIYAIAAGVLITLSTGGFE